MDLVASDPKVGRISWRFENKNRKTRGETPYSILVERMAMVRHWLQEPVIDWLQKELPPSAKIVSKNATTFNTHEAQRLLSETKVGTLSSLRGLRERRIDVAWVCPVDGRLYHLASTQTSRQPAQELPADWKVDCCVSMPAVTGEEV